MWKLYHTIKAGLSLSSGNVSWAGYHAFKAASHKPNHRQKGQNGETGGGWQSGELQNGETGCKVFLKGEDKTSQIESFTTTKENNLRVKFFGNDKTYTYTPQNYKIVKA